MVKQMSAMTKFLARPRMHRKALLITLFTLLGAPAFADVYRWVDKEGAVHYSDMPPQGIESKRMQITPTDASKAPDEGELRRRRLLEEADREAARRIKAQQARSAARQAEHEAGLAQKKRCLEAREALAVLQEQLPVYRDNEGKLRDSWARDTYRGEREYLNDAVRAAEIERVRQKIATICQQPGDTKKQDLARKQMIRSEYCATARAELKDFQRPDARVSQQELEAQRKRVEYYCQEPSEEDL